MVLTYFYNLHADLYLFSVMRYLGHVKRFALVKIVLVNKKGGNKAWSKYQY